MKKQLTSLLQGVPHVFRWVLIGLVIAAISLLFPNNISFPYDFERGQTWRYDDLNAPFEFAVLKPEVDIERERAQAMTDFPSYYSYKPEVAQEQIAAFEAALDEELKMVRADSASSYRNILTDPEPYRAYGVGLLRRMYDRGLVSLRDTDRGLPATSVIKIVKGNTTQTETIQNVVTAEMMLSRIPDTIRTATLPNAGFLIGLLQAHIQPNITFSEMITSDFLQQRLDKISPTRGIVRKGELIVLAEGIVTDEVYQKLRSYKQQYEKEVVAQRNDYGVFVGYLILTTLLVGIYIVFLRAYFREVFESTVQLTFVLFWLLVYSYLVFMIENVGTLSVYLIPFCIVPIVIKNFYNDRLALFTHIVIVLIASFISSLSYEFTLILIVAGMVAVFANIHTQDWSRFFFSMLYIFGTYAFVYLGLRLTQEGSLDSVDWNIYGWFFFSTFLTLLAYPLIPLLERIFGFTSTITLVELSDMNRPLLKRLSTEAPGTLQHSLQVANLGEAVANAIGIDPLPVKVGALYHDIGKLARPQYFIENQNDGNPHDDLDYRESAKIIISHVTEGARLARKARLPKQLIDIILSHHGTTRTEYFYRKYQQAHPGETIDDTAFRYPGPKPVTKPEGILMLADSIEAASKSLRNPTGQDIDQLVDGIVDHKLKLGQFEHCELTFAEVTTSRGVFKRLLRSIRHVRVEYPDAKESASIKDPSEASERAPRQRIDITNDTPGSRPGPPRAEPERMQEGMLPVPGEPLPTVPTDDDDDTTTEPPEYHPEDRKPN